MVQFTFENSTLHKHSYSIGRGIGINLINNGY